MMVKVVAGVSKASLDIWRVVLRTTPRARGFAASR